MTLKNVLSLNFIKILTENPKSSERFWLSATLLGVSLPPIQWGVSVKKVSAISAGWFAWSQKQT